MVIVWQKKVYIYKIYGNYNKIYNLSGYSMVKKRKENIEYVVIITRYTISNMNEIVIMLGVILE